MSMQLIFSPYSFQCKHINFQEKLFGIRSNMNIWLQIKLLNYSTTKYLTTSLTSINVLGTKRILAHWLILIPLKNQLDHTIQNKQNTSIHEALAQWHSHLNHEYSSKNKIPIWYALVYFNNTRKQFFKTSLKKRGFSTKSTSKMSNTGTGCL